MFAIDFIANVLFILLCYALQLVGTLVWLLMLVIGTTVTLGYHILRLPLLYREVRALRKELATQ